MTKWLCPSKRCMIFLVSYLKATQSFYCQFWYCVMKFQKWYDVLQTCDYSWDRITIFRLKPFKEFYLVSTFIAIEINLFISSLFQSNFLHILIRKFMATLFGVHIHKSKICIILVNICEFCTLLDKSQNMSTHALL